MRGSASKGNGVDFGCSKLRLGARSCAARRAVDGAALAKAGTERSTERRSLNRSAEANSTEALARARAESETDLMNSRNCKHKQRSLHEGLECTVRSISSRQLVVVGTAATSFGAVAIRTCTWS